MLFVGFHVKLQKCNLHWFQVYQISWYERSVLVYLLFHYGYAMSSAKEFFVLIMYTYRNFHRLIHSDSFWFIKKKRGGADFIYSSSYTQTLVYRLRQLHKNHASVYSVLSCCCFFLHTEAWYNYENITFWWTFLTILNLVLNGFWQY